MREDDGVVGVDAERLRSILDPGIGSALPGETHTAAVAALFRPGPTGTELLFIQRASRDGDPWSGQMAFPGGRFETVDTDLAATAERETMEEIGFDLGRPDVERLGALSPLDGGRAVSRLTLVEAYAYWLADGPDRFDFNAEVADVLWIPLVELSDPVRHIDYVYPRNGQTFPGVQLDRETQVVWGLTLRFLVDLFRRLGYPFLNPDSPV